MRQLCDITEVGGSSKSERSSLTILRGNVVFDGNVAAGKSLGHQIFGLGKS